MASHFTLPIVDEPQSLEVVAGVPRILTGPFKVLVASLQTDTISITVSPYSQLFSGLDVSTVVPIIGLDYLIENVKYGHKVWLEVFYDANLSPVVGVIKTPAFKWPDTYISPSTKQPVTVYPNNIELITKDDLADKTTEIKTLVTQCDALKVKLQAAIDSDIALGYLTAERGGYATSRLNTQFSTLKTALNKYQSDMSAFFSGAPATHRKQFKSFTLLAYTTLDDSNFLQGENISLLNYPIQSSPQKTDSIKFKLVQSISTDLLVADMFYLNRYPAKLPIPWVGGVYPYYNPDTAEETTNIA